MTKIEAVLFDVDGTLLDTVDFIVHAYSHTARIHGFADVTREMVIDVGGQGLEECYAIFAPTFDPAGLCDTHRDFQLSITDQVSAYPSALPVLAAMRERGLRTAAVTSRRTTALRTLEFTGLSGLLDVIVTGDDVVKCKPHPEGIDKALNLLGATAATSIMVGDTASDIQAARAAGLRVVGVTYGFYNSADYLAYPPDFVIADLLELPALVDSLL